MTAAMLIVVLINGLGVFWPSALAELTLTDGQKVLGIATKSNVNADTSVLSLQFKTGNRDFDSQRSDFHWYEQTKIAEINYPPDVFVLERQENGDFYGVLKQVLAPTVEVADGGSLVDRFGRSRAAVRRIAADEMDPLTARLSTLSYQLQQLRYELLDVDYHRKQLAAGASGVDASRLDARKKEIEAAQSAIKNESDRLVARQDQFGAEARRNVAVFALPSGREATIPLVNIVHAYQPNAMGFGAKCGIISASSGNCCGLTRANRTPREGCFPPSSAP